MKFKRIALIVIAVLIIIALIHFVNIIIYSRNIDYINKEYVLDEKYSNLDGLRMALITDTHSVSIEDVEKMVEQLNKDDVDIIALSGDLHKSATYVIQAMSKAKSTYGAFVIEGNHDSDQNLKQMCEENSVRYLDNEGLSLTDGLFIAGVPDLWYSNPSPPEAMLDANDDDFIVLLAHNPDISMDLDCSKADLVLSGHTHGGHVTIFGMIKPMLAGVTRYPMKFGGGWSTGASGEKIYVSKGAGYYDSWFLSRVFARPEVVYIDLVIK